MGRSDCRSCGHKHFNQGVGPCKHCFCTTFRGFSQVPRSARRSVPSNSHLERMILERRMARRPTALFS